ncbi:MAG: hypothetical protein R2750_06225 [Bacteroidales bacterium]
MSEPEAISQNDEIKDFDKLIEDEENDIESEISKIVIPTQITALLDAAKNGAPFCEEIAQKKEEPE